MDFSGFVAGVLRDDVQIVEDFFVARVHQDEELIAGEPGLQGWLGGAENPGGAEIPVQAQNFEERLDEISRIIGGINEVKAAFFGRAGVGRRPEDGAADEVTQEVGRHGKIGRAHV